MNIANILCAEFIYISYHSPKLKGHRLLLSLWDDINIIIPLSRYHAVDDQTTPAT